MLTRVRRTVSLDVARTLGTIAVVAIHAVGMSTALLENDALSWWTKTIMTSLSVWAVPVFVMISGALLLGKESHQSARDFYVKRLWRVGIPALIWIPTYFVFDHFYRGDSLAPSFLISRVLLSSYDHLYFLVLITQLYLLTPLFRKLLTEISQQSLFGLVALFFCMTLFWKKTSFAGTMFVPFIGYYLAGAYLYRQKLSSKLASLAAAIFLFTAVVIIFLTYKVSLVNEVAYLQDQYFYSHNKLFVVLLALSVFVAVQSVPWTQGKWKINQFKIQQFAEASFGIYILHPLILYLIARVADVLFHLHKFTWWMQLAAIPLALFGSWFLTMLLQKNRWTRLLIGC